MERLFTWFSARRGQAIVGILGCALLVVGMAGCGESSNTPSTSSGSVSGSSQTTASTSASTSNRTKGQSENPYDKALATAEAAAPAKLSGGAVAIVNGTPITMASYQHWLEASAPASIKPLIANPSDYSACISALKAREQAEQKLVKKNEESLAKAQKGRKASRSLFRDLHRARTETQYKKQCEQSYQDERLQAVRTLINRAWTEGEAKELGVTLNQGEVAKQLKVREEEQKRLAKVARGSEFAGGEANYGAADLKEMISSSVLEQLVYKKVREKFAKTSSVSQTKLEKYFDEHKQIYAEPERRSIVYLSTKSKSTADAIAGEHGNLSKAASKHGVTATPTTVSCQQQNKTGGEGILVKICAAKTGVMSGPDAPTSSSKAASIFYLFEVKSTTPATKPNFAQAKEKIKQLLSTQGESLAASKYSEETREKLKARTECAKGYVVELCKEYVAPTPARILKARPLKH